MLLGLRYSLPPSTIHQHRRRCSWLRRIAVTKPPPKVAVHYHISTSRSSGRSPFEHGLWSGVLVFEVEFVPDGSWGDDDTAGGGGLLFDVTSNYQQHIILAKNVIAAPTAGREVRLLLLICVLCLCKVTLILIVYWFSIFIGYHHDIPHSLYCRTDRREGGVIDYLSVSFYRSERSERGAFIYCIVVFESLFWMTCSV